MRPVAERIWFPGEALAGPLMQTCGGARALRRRAALRIAAGR